MNFEESNIENAVDRLLSEYLLERDPLGLNGESLMEEAALGEMGRGPSLMPPSAKEAEITEKLKASMKAMPQPLPSAAGWWTRAGIYTAAAATLLIVIWFAVGTGADSAQGMALHQVSPARHTLPGTPGNFASAQPQSLLNIAPDKAPGDNSMMKHQSLSNRDFSRSLWDFISPDPLGLAGLQRDVPVVAPDRPRQLSSEFFAGLSPIPQSYSVDNSKGILLETGSGTLIHVPAGAFTNANGETVQGPVTLTVKEAFSSSEMILSGLQFITGDQYFAALSALEIKASLNNLPLELANGKTLYVELPAGFMKAGTDVYTSSGNGSSWNRSGGKDNTLVPLPSEKMYFEQFWCSDHRDQQWNDFLIDFNSPEFANTWVSTLQFRERLNAAWDLGHNGHILQIYKENINRELWQVDEMVATYMENMIMPDGFTPPYDATEKFRSFASQGYTRVIPYSDYGVDPSAANGFALLRQKNVSDSEANEIIRLHYQRKMEITALESNIFTERRSNGKPGKLKSPEDSPRVKIRRGIRMDRLGWVASGCAVKASEADQPVNVRWSSAQPIEQLQIFYAGESMRTIYSAELNANGSAKVLPFGSKFNRLTNRHDDLIALGYHKGQPWMAIQSLQPGTTEATLQLKPVDFATLRSSLTVIDND